MLLVILLLCQIIDSLAIWPSRLPNHKLTVHLDCESVNHKYSKFDSEDYDACEMTIVTDLICYTRGAHCSCMVYNGECQARCECA